MSIVFNGTLKPLMMPLLFTRIFYMLLIPAFKKNVSTPKHTSVLLKFSLGLYDYLSSRHFCMSLIPFKVCIEKTSQFFIWLILFITQAFVSMTYLKARKCVSNIWHFAWMIYMWKFVSALSFFPYINKHNPCMHTNTAINMTVWNC